MGVGRGRMKWAAAFAAGVAVALGAVQLMNEGVFAQSTPNPDGVSSRRWSERSVTVTQPDFRQVAKKVIPSVVTVRSTKEVDLTRFHGSGQGQMDELFERFFGRRAPGGQERGPDSQTQHGLGSGVIVSADGYVLTNNHVVDEVDSVEIVTSDGVVHPAEIVGTDDKSDIAVLKVKATGLTAIDFGDSDALEVGEWVLAVGNPFSESLGHTVTHGIVSATGRTNLSLADYEDFIQTDAAVNPGNSGGALVNVAGQLIGINTAIVSRSGGYQGVSFAIPVKMARNVMDQLVSTGKVTRGYIGVGIQNLDADLAEAMGLKVTDGVVVTQIYDGTPAADAGLLRADVVRRLDGEAVKDVAQLRNRIAATAPGTTVKLDVIRDGRDKMVPLQLGELPASGTIAAGSNPREAEQEDLGIAVQTLTPDVAQELNLAGETGVVIRRVKSGSAAAEAGLRQGDLIIEVNRTPVRDLASYRAALGDVVKSKLVLFYVRRGEGSVYVPVRP